MGKYLTLFIFYFLLITQLIGQSVNTLNVSFNEFEIKNTSIRAIEVVNDSTIWFAGSKGKYGRIMNGHLQIDSIQLNDKILNFRSIAFNGKDIFFLSIENPAVLYKIDPLDHNLANPKIVYSEKHGKVFYDSMTFFDKVNGIAIGDATDDCLSIIRTNDGGNTWQKLNCNNLPKIFEGEAAFAASNSNIATYDKTVWIVTGGKKARIFKSDNYGKDWNVVDSPITQGGKMTGIFAVDFFDKNNGIIMGGNWEKKSDTKKTKATTNDGGTTWKLIADDQIPGYISCVQYIPETNGKEVIAVSTQGIYYSNNKGAFWSKISEKGFYGIRFVNKKTAWLSGNNKIAKMQIH